MTKTCGNCKYFRPEKRNLAGEIVGDCVNKNAHWTKAKSTWTIDKSKDKARHCGPYNGNFLDLWVGSRGYFRNKWVHL